jgi:hypothetical protein
MSTCILVVVAAGWAWARWLGGDAVIGTRVSSRAER